MSTRVHKVAIEYEVRGTDKVRADNDDILNAISSRFDKVDVKIERLESTMKRFGKTQVDVLGGVSTAAASAADKTAKSFEGAHAKIETSAKTSHRKVTETVGSESRKQVEHIRSVAELQQQYSNKSTAVLLANVQKNISAINDENRLKTEAIWRGDKEEANAHGMRLRRIQIEQNTLRNLAAQRDEVKYFGAGASVGILGTGRNVFTPDQLRSQLASAKASMSGYVKDIELLHKREAATEIAINEAKTLAERGNISNVVAADITAKATRVKAALALKEQEITLEKAVTGNVVHEIEKRVAAAEAGVKAQEKIERDKVASEAKSEILGQLGVGEIGRVGLLAGKVGIGGGAGLLAAGAGALTAGTIVYEGFKKLEEGAAEFERAEDRVAIALTRSGLPLKLREQELDRLRGKAKEVADEFAMQDEEVKDVQATIIAYGGAAGKTLDRLTEITIGVSKATGLEYDMVAKMIAKGTDPENKAEMQRIGLYLDKNLTMQQRMNVVEREWGTMVDEAKDKMKGGTHEWDRLISKVDDLRKEKAHEIFEKIGTDIQDATPHILDMADAFGTKLVHGITQAETVAREFYKPIKSIVDLAESINSTLDKGYTAVGSAGAFVFNKLGLQVSEGQANAFRAMEGKDPLNPAYQLPSLKSGHASMFDTGGTAEEWLKRHPRPERPETSGGGASKSIEQINRDAFEKQRETIDAEEAHRLALLNAAHNRQAGDEHEFKKSELRAEIQYQGELSKLMVDGRGQIIKGLEKQYKETQDQILLKNSEIVKEQRDEDKEAFGKQLDQTENFYLDRDRAIDLANARGLLSQREYDRTRYDADRDALLAELGMIRFMLGEGSQEYATYYKRLADLDHAHAVKQAGDLRDQIKQRRDLIDDTNKRHIEALADSYDKEYLLARLQYERDVRAAREAAKQKGDDQLLVQQELYRQLSQLREDYTARVQRLDQERFEKTSGLKEGLQSGEAVANKGAFDAIDKQFNSGNNIAGTVGASMAKRGIESLENAGNDWLSKQLSKIFETKANTKVDIKNPQITALDANTQATIENTNALRGTASPAAATKLGSIDLGTGEITPEGVADKLNLKKYAGGALDTGDKVQLALLHPHETVIPEGVDLGGLQSTLLPPAMDLGNGQRIMAGAKPTKKQDLAGDIIQGLIDRQKAENEALKTMNAMSKEAREMSLETTAIGHVLTLPRKQLRSQINDMLKSGLGMDDIKSSLISSGGEVRDKFAESVGKNMMNYAVVKPTETALEVGLGAPVEGALAPVLHGLPLPHLLKHGVQLAAGHYAGGKLASPVDYAAESAMPEETPEGQPSSKEMASTALEGTKNILGFTKAIADLSTTSDKASKSVDKTKDTVSKVFGGAEKASMLLDPTGTAGTVIGLLGGLFGGGFEDGDYTGDGDPKKVAGPAHHGEFYFDYKTTRKVGLNQLRALKYGKASIVPHDLMPMSKTSYDANVSLMPIQASSYGQGGGGHDLRHAMEGVADRMEAAVERINNSVPAGAMFGAMQSIQRSRSNVTWNSY